MPYDPKPTCYPYPEYTDKHYLHVKKDDGMVFDEHYPYVNRSKAFLFKKALMRIGTVLIAFPIIRLRFGLRIEGRKYLRQHKKELQRGVISCSNHVLMWDFIVIMRAIAPFIPYTVSWDKDVRGENKTLIRLAGGIPLPVGSIKATVAFNNAINQLLQQGKWVHFYAEGSMWEYYMPVRPFKKGAFTYAVHNDKPALPLGFSYRQPKGLQRLFHKKPLITLRIGQLIYPDHTLSKAEASRKMCEQAHDSVCRLCGIEPSHNIYPPLFNGSKRIDYYDLNATVHADTTEHLDT